MHNERFKLYVVRELTRDNNEIPFNVEDGVDEYIWARSGLDAMIALYGPNFDDDKELEVIVSEVDPKTKTPYSGLV